MLEKLPCSDTHINSKALALCGGRHGAGLKKLEIVTAIINRRDRNAHSDHYLHSRIRTRRLQPDSSAKRESREDRWQSEFFVQPIESGADIVHFAPPMIVFALAQSGAAKIET